RGTWRAVVAERGVGRVGPVDVEVPLVDLVAGARAAVGRVTGHEVGVGCPGRWAGPERPALGVARQQAAVLRPDGELHRGSRLASICARSNAVTVTPVNDAALRKSLLLM